METIVTEIWSKSKLLIKTLVIGGLVLILLIPTYYVQDLIKEREARQKEAITEVGQKWAGKQTLTGPMLVIPYLLTTTDTTKKAVPEKHYAYILPSELTIHATVLPQEKHRGIYKVLLYTSETELSGAFDNMAFDNLKIPADKILWNEAFLQINLTDPKGLNDELKFSWKDTALTFTPNSSFAGKDNGESLVAPLPVSNRNDLSNAKFSSSISLSGSEQLLFTPLGKTTTVTVNSKWPHPSFTGSILPQSTAINDNGFTASWKSLAHKRAFPQQFKDRLPSDSSSFASASFGVGLFVPVNDYQKIMRCIKYAILCIALTFTAFFLIETVSKTSAHPFQYGLIGLALVLFYTLLLSFSEYIGFDPAYIISSLCTIGLIGWFVSGILKSSRLSVILSTVLILLYSYVFTILQLQDYALLLGSIGLFLSLAVVMYFSRNVQW